MGWIKEKGKEDYEEQKLSDLEILILKPHKEVERIAGLTEEEIQKYLEIDVEALKKKEINEKIIRICTQTQAYIRENLEDILTIIRQKNTEKEEKEENKYGQDR